MPGPPDASEEGDRCLGYNEPGRVPHRFGKGGKRHKTTIFPLHQPVPVHVPPPAAVQIADIGDGLALVRDRRKPPPQQGELTSAGCVISYDRRILVGIDVLLGNEIVGRRCGHQLPVKQAHEGAHLSNGAPLGISVTHENSEIRLGTNSKRLTHVPVSFFLSCFPEGRHRHAKA